MNNELQIFNFNDCPFRAVDEHGNYWFVAKDVCDILGIQNHRDAISALDEDEKDGVGISDAIGRVQNTSVISESGLYSLIFRSNKPQAKVFRKWVTSEVLPTLRKTGRYEMAGADQPRQQPVDLVVKAIGLMMLDRGSFRGTVAQLHHRLTDYVSISEQKSPEWPTNPSDFGYRLKVLTPVLWEERIEVRRLPRQSHGIMVEIVPASSGAIEMHVAGLRWKMSELQREIEEIEHQATRMLR